ncbi:tyrosinase family protein [Massilia sp. LXY-6]|uniref:tyrosinase family protein n=1 Tax=Massilia sp. LXY-6 TaxID=3379823 RepID=UPI003EE24691
MSSILVGRREFINTSASAIALLSFPRIGFGQTTTSIRLEWQQFKTTAQYSSFVNAVRKMKANTNAASPSSWEYWTNVHLNYCPHGIAYFLAWHRGYLYYLEQQLRTVSGDKTLSVPYWNYYKYPHIPSEFTDPTPGNPLYMPRVGTNVYNALSMAPFASGVWNFQRGTTNAFEPQLESAPHNPVHNLIGGEMANMMSPRDPIFFLHHANIDRLCHAWALPDGKGIPPTSNPYNAATSSPYWAGSFTYASGLTMARYKTYYPGWLNFDYSDDTKPTALPLAARTQPQSPIRLVQAQVASRITRPATGSFATTAARGLSPTRRALGGVSGVVLTEASVSGHLPLAASSLQSLHDAVAVAVEPPARTLPGTFRSVVVVLDNVQMLGAGAKGGFFYNVYMNLPAIVDTDNAHRYLLGTLGAFEVAGAAHHGGATLEYQATELLSKLSAYELQDVSVSFVRVSGENAPRGAVMRIGELRIDISTDAPWAPSPPTQRGQCYC